MFSWLCPCKVHCLRFCEHFISGECCENNRHKVAFSFYSIWPPTVFFDSRLSCFPTVQLQPLWWIAIVFLLISKLPYTIHLSGKHIYHKTEKKKKRKKCLTLQDRLWNHFILNSQKANQRFFSPSDNWICGLEGGQGHTVELIVNWKVITAMSVTVCEASWPASSVRWLLLLELITYTMRKKRNFFRDHFLSVTPMREFLCRDASKCSGQ